MYEHNVTDLGTQDDRARQETLHSTAHMASELRLISPGRSHAPVHSAVADNIAAVQRPTIDTLHLANVQIIMSSTPETSAVWPYSGSGSSHNSCLPPSNSDVQPDSDTDTQPDLSTPPDPEQLGIVAKYSPGNSLQEHDRHGSYGDLLPKLLSYQNRRSTSPTPSSRASASEVSLPERFCALLERYSLDNTEYGLLRQSFRIVRQLQSDWDNAGRNNFLTKVWV